MKVQNTLSLDQAQRLDKAIKDAGLEWPDIEWERYFLEFESEEDDEKEFFLEDKWVECTHLQGFPAPNLAELAKMMPKHGKDIPVPIIQVGSILFILISWIETEPETIKAHWQSITQ